MNRVADGSARTADAMLHEAGLRATPQRQAILTVVSDARDHPTAEDILERTREVDPTIAISTVYRTLAALEGAGLVQKLGFEDAPARYESATNRDHAHLIDIDTGEIFEISDKETRAIHQIIADNLGYDLINFRTIFCARKKTAKGS